VSTRLDRAADDVTHLRGRVAALSPAATLARGYAVVQTRDGEVVRDPADIGDGVLLRLRLVGGDLAARAAGPWVPDALPTTTRKARSTKKAAAPAAAPKKRARAAAISPPAPTSPPDPTEADA
jgi:exodeoxyribonuclease VII large subunit